MNPAFQESYFTKHALNTQTGIKFEVEKINKDGYEVEVNRIIK